MRSIAGIYAEKSFQIANLDSGESIGYAGKHEGISGLQLSYKGGDGKASPAYMPVHYC